MPRQTQIARPRFQTARAESSSWQEQARTSGSGLGPGRHRVLGITTLQPFFQGNWQLLASLALPRGMNPSPGEGRLHRHTICLLPLPNCIKILFVCLKMKTLCLHINTNNGTKTVRVSPHMTRGFHHLKVLDLVPWRTLDIIYSNFLLLTVRKNESHRSLTT